MAKSTYFAAVLVLKWVKEIAAFEALSTSYFIPIIFYFKTKIVTLNVYGVENMGKMACFLTKIIELIKKEPYYHYIVGVTA